MLNFFEEYLKIFQLVDLLFLVINLIKMVEILKDGIVGIIKSFVVVFIEGGAGFLQLTIISLLFSSLDVFIIILLF
jgi:hypothetical protein